MNVKEFREKAYEMIDYIVHYFESVSEKPVLSNAYPGYLKGLIPDTPPEAGESFDKIMEDFEKYIMSSITHWQHPGFHGFLPSNSSYAGILAEMMSDIMGCVGFNRNSCPSGSELETIVLDWYGKMIGLPEIFLHYGEDSKGGGSIQSTASDCILLCLITARQNVLKEVTEKKPAMSKQVVLSSLTAYCSTESHSSFFKAVKLSMVNVKIIDTDQNYRLKTETLAKAIADDKKIGSIPFFVFATIGTGTGACDPIDEIGPICKEHGIWLHVDAAYAGNAMICPEYKYIFEGMEHASSFNVSPSKWLLVPLNLSVVFVKDRFKFDEFIIINKRLFEYGSDENDRRYISNRISRAMRLWVVLSSYGIEGLQRHIRNHVKLAKMFHSYINEDERFEALVCQFGIVCFRLKSSEIMNRYLVKQINSSGKLLLTSYILDHKSAIRFVVCNEHANEEDIKRHYSIISEFAERILQKDQVDLINSTAVSSLNDFNLGL